MSREKKSGKPSKGGGAKRQPDPDRKPPKKAKKDKGRSVLRRPPIFGCTNCGSPIDPDWVWNIELVEDITGHVLVTHHCYCLKGDPDSCVLGRYAVEGMDFALAYLMSFSGEGVVHTVEGSWRWETAHKRYAIPPSNWAVREFADDLAQLIRTPADFLRACGEPR